MFDGHLDVVVIKFVYTGPWVKLQKGVNSRWSRHYELGFGQEHILHRVDRFRVDRCH